MARRPKPALAKARPREDLANVRNDSLPRPGPRGPGHAWTWEAVRVAGRRLLTIGPDHPAWKDDLLPTLTGKAGDIVRLRPPPGTPKERVEAVKDAFLALGAARVRAELQRPATTPREALERQSAPRSSARQVVLELATEANVADRPALAALLGRLMDEEGL